MPSADLQTLVDHIAAEMAQEADRGKVADYIPPLALVSPDRALARVVEKTGWSVFRTDRYGAA